MPTNPEPSNPEPTMRTPRPTPTPVRLGDVFAALSMRAESLVDLTVTGVTLDSRDVRPGDLFVALSGERAHGATFAEQAASCGAVAIATDRDGAEVAESVLPTLLVDDLRNRVGELAAEIYRRPADELLVLAVTGTNGKTTTTYLLEAGLRAAGHRTGLIGTIATLIDGEAFETVRTTPEAPELHALLAVMRERGVTAVAMEVSSHALAMGRVDGCRFDVAGFTQLGVDHLDFHGSEASYFAAKQMLFEQELSKAAVIAIDDDGGRRMASASRAPTVTVGTAAGADWSITDIRERMGGGYDFALTTPQGSREQGRVRLMGRFNVVNAGLAQVMLRVAGVAPEVAARGVGDCQGIPGRMERIGPGDVALVVDYAHTADALSRAIEAVTPDADGKVIVVFGCGGDRDPSKREPMGNAAAAGAAVVVVTDDNPRSEDPEAIRHAVVAGTAQVPAAQRAEVVEVGDRRAAIELAVRRAQPGDVVLVAGKGHESGQEVGGEVTAFDDRVELLDAWERVCGPVLGDRP